MLSPFKVAATNGHTLIVIDSDDAHGLPIGQIVDVKAAIKCMEVGAPIQSSEERQFPTLEHVIPPLGRIDRGESLETRAVAVNPNYMADAMGALSFCESVRITYATNDASALRLDGRADGLRAIVVIMPVRQRFAQRDDMRDPCFTDDPAKCAA